MSLKCWVNKHSYVEMFEADVALSTSTRTRFTLFKCKHCNKYKTTWKITYHPNGQEESSLTCTTTNKKLSIFNGSSN